MNQPTKSVFFLVPLLGIPACVEMLGDDCRNTATCPPPEDATGGTKNTGGSGASDGDGGLGGQSTGGTESSGGTNSGGTRSGGANNSGGTGGTEPDPCDACTGDTPVCMDDECVPCTEDDSGSCADTELCTSEHECVPCIGEEAPGCAEGEVCTEDNECVTCTENAHCTDPAASLCTDENECAPCVENEDCAHVDGLSVCDGGECVQCATADDCDEYVCDPVAHACTDIPARSEDICRACVHDEQCLAGQVCVEMEYDDPSQGVVGSFCLWLKDAELPGPDGSCGLSSRPYAQLATVSTVDGATATICRLATTTCPAFLQHRKTIADCETEFVDDNACGDPNFHDGRCRNNSSSEPKCSYPCGGNEDCPAGFTCPEGSDRYCSL